MNECGGFAAGYYEGLQDKLTQLRDAREALDSLRDEHREKRRREMEEMERQRQIQMMQKLEVMRQKKHVSVLSSYRLFVCLLKAYSSYCPTNRTGSPRSFSQIQFLHMSLFFFLSI